MSPGPFDRRAARAEAQSSPPCSFYFPCEAPVVLKKQAEGRFGVVIAGRNGFGPQARPTFSNEISHGDDGRTDSCDNGGTVVGRFFG